MLSKVECREGIFRLSASAKVDQGPKREDLVREYVVVACFPSPTKFLKTKILVTECSDFLSRTNSKVTWHSQRWRIGRYGTERCITDQLGRRKL